MLYIEVLLLAIGLSMDSLAVSVTGGAVLKNNCTAGNIIKIASVLGIFQAGMTVSHPVWVRGLKQCQGRGLVVPSSEERVFHPGGDPGRCTALVG